MEIAPIYNNAVVATAAAVTASTLTSQHKQRQRRSAAASAATAFAKTTTSKAAKGSAVNGTVRVNHNDNVNNLALLASLTLQKALNINNINNNAKSSDSVSSYQQQQNKATTKIAAIKVQQLQQQKQQQRRHSDNETENDVLNQLLKTGAVFTTTTATAAGVAVSAPITIDKKTEQQQKQQQHANSAQKQRLNSSISSTNSSSSTNSYGSSCSSTEDQTGTATATITGGAATTALKSSSIKLPEKSKIPSDILDDLASRFIINVPDMELNNLIRICFQIELAHWFYLDFFCAPEDSDNLLPPQHLQQQRQRRLPVVGIKQFAVQVFQHIPFLNKHFGTVDQILAEWKNYKQSVPTYGAILVSEDLNHCLLVQSYFARNSWGFPKGKINENEVPAHCATREVYEETGFDITDIIDADDYIEALINYQYTRLYIVRNIPLDTPFAPRTRNEIKCCDWFRIDALPVNKNDAISKAKLGKNSNSFFMIIPFVKRLKKWVSERRSETGETAAHRRKCSGQQSPKSILNAAAVSPTMLMNSNNNINNNSSNSCCKKEHQRAASRRQRHKSMGDLDGVKLNNLNGKTTANVGGNGGSGCGIIAASNICNSNIKRNSTSNNKQVNVAAGSNIITTTTSIAIVQPLTGTATTPTAATAFAAVTATSKRQLFHSQSQNDAQQPASNEKIVSSFDLIRKEKQQQLKAAKAQKQQHQQRSRTKSQSDKQSHQQQLVVKSTLSRNNTQQQQKQKQQQTTPTTGMDLIAMLTAAAAATPKPEQRPRPASVSLNMPTAPIVSGGSSNVNSGCSSSAPDAETLRKLKRMASGTDLTNLKRAQSQHEQQVQLQHQQHLQVQQQEQEQLQQQGPLNFTPTFNSWTNFSFTKNFIANVFC